MITLHHCPQTRSMRSLWLLHELDVDFRVHVHPFDKSLRAPEFLNLSPAGRVPALEIDGHRMFETGAITQYLCERFSPDGLGRSPSAPERMDWLVWVHFAETVSQHAAALTQQHVVLYDDNMRSPTVMKLEAARLGKCYDAIEARLSDPSAERDYLLTSGFSAADVSVGQAVYMARYFRTFDDHPALARWFERITERPAFQASLPDVSDRLYDQDFYPAWEA
ncbi:glutathione S-transferase family protein [uncultured Tateyamaria sp.]|uniref:glutathione S-transferase family protein n=1 Tax=uncultured Tateyamaria sp. TaxID=455651 RepID=UPI0026355C16|nr:glutathione S-transferase family protein [uncultured Tateyamaria sp.]